MNLKGIALSAIGVIALAVGSNAMEQKQAVELKAIGIHTSDEQSPKRVYVSGNVDVTLVQDLESKQLYQKEGKAKIYTEGDAVYVEGKKGNERAQVTLYVGEIYRVDVSGNASVNSKNTLNTRFLQVILSDQAKATINSRTEGLYTKLKNEAELTLNGITRHHTITTNSLAVLNTKNLRAVQVELEKRESPDYAQF